ncbi:uncharacterized protein PV09_04330 [Verruconis gallopava]|uniref:BZIP domain-containing protein n=1 Tax=Verruconis gallopava TaxID=253628 RepID=A0A0D1XPV6_9PEZI|nr:uncharacterized protein PV09_04330 [Verruconis gallopava]KIW04581.1 hypothetical protein PV09_04330 [Verruconis gallopava]
MSSFAFIDVGEPSADRRRRNANQARSLVMTQRRRRERVLKNASARSEQQIAASEKDDEVEAPLTHPQGRSPPVFLTTWNENTTDVFYSALLRQGLQSEGLSNSSILESSLEALRGYNKPVTIHMHKLINHVIQIIWPKYWPSKDLGQASPLVNEWWPMFSHNPAVFHGFLYAAAVHHDDLLGRTEISQSREILLHKHEAFKRLQVAINDIRRPEAINESFVLAMAYLGMESDEHDRDRESVESCPFNAPGILQSIQWTRHYAYAKENAHIQAATRLIGLKGGLDGLSLPLAKSMAINDLQIAAKYIRKPVFPFWDIAEIVRAFEDPNVNAVPEDTNQLPTCLGFQSLLSLGLPLQLSGILRRTALISRKIDFYSRGELLQADFHVLLCERNYVHHNLLSTPSAIEIGLVNQEHHIYECCRIGGLLFSTGVLYPLPPSTGAPNRLVQIAKRVVESISLETCMLGGGKLLIWMIVLAAIMARDTIERPWFLKRLKAMLAMENITSWSDLKSALVTFLWMDSACDDAAKCLYEDLSRPPFL